jgi:hypothetical protein
MSFNLGFLAARSRKASKTACSNFGSVLSSKLNSFDSFPFMDMIFIIDFSFPAQSTPASPAKRADGTIAGAFWPTAIVP